VVINAPWILAGSKYFGVPSSCMCRMNVPVPGVVSLALVQAKNWEKPFTSSSATASLLGERLSGNQFPTWPHQ